MIEAKVKFNLCNVSETNDADFSSSGSGVRMPPLCGALYRLLGSGAREDGPTFNTG